MAAEMSKREMRERMRRRRAECSALEVQRSSRCVCARLLDLSEVISARCLALYAAFAGEVDLWALARHARDHGRHLLLPRFHVASGTYEMACVTDLDADLVPGRFGILEPRPHSPRATAEQCRGVTTVWFVPGLAFDARGNRLGFGAGYYDRLLHGCQGIRIGVGYDWQVVAAVPAETHDEAMDTIATNQSIVRCFRAAGVPETDRKGVCT